MSAVLGVVGVNSRLGKPLLALVLPHVREGKIYLTPGQHAGLCGILDSRYPMAAGTLHTGEFVFGMEVVIEDALLEII